MAQKYEGTVQFSRSGTINFDALIPVNSADHCTFKTRLWNFYYVKTTELPELCTGEQIFDWRQFSKTTKTEYREKTHLTQPLSLLLLVSYLSHHQPAVNFPPERQQGRRVRLKGDIPTVVQQCAAFAQTFCNIDSKMNMNSISSALQCSKNNVNAWKWGHWHT